jgi:ankyrin repeat protein
VNQVNNICVTPLFIACQEGHTEVVTTLLAANAKVGLASNRGLPPLYVACHNGHTEVVTKLLAANASVDQADDKGVTPLFIACQKGRTEIVTKLLAANADVNRATNKGITPLLCASQKGHTDVVAKLLAANAEVDQTDRRGSTPMAAACRQGNLSIVQLLCSYGASRTFTMPGHELTAEEFTADRGHHDLDAWLVRSRHWTHLHYVEIITPKRAFDLLRAGAAILVAARAGDSTPLALAQNLAAAGRANEGTAAHLVLEAAKPWSRQTHKLFPAPARARAVELMLIGELLSREERFAAYGPQAVVDAWMHLVVPKSVSRDRVQVVGLKGRPELNGKTAWIGELNEAKGRYPVTFEDDEKSDAVLIKMMNLVAIGDIGDDE